MVRQAVYTRRYGLITQRYRVRFPTLLLLRDGVFAGAVAFVASLVCW